RITDDTLLIILNADPEPAAFRLPAAPAGWQVLVDTRAAAPPAEDAAVTGDCALEPRSLVLLRQRAEGEGRGGEGGPSPVPSGHRLPPGGRGTFIDTNSGTRCCRRTPARSEGWEWGYPARSRRLRQRAYPQVRGDVGADDRAAPVESDGEQVAERAT